MKYAKEYREMFAEKEESDVEIAADRERELIKTWNTLQKLQSKVGAIMYNSEFEDHIANNYKLGPAFAQISDTLTDLMGEIDDEIDQIKSGNVALPA